jgi:hypothetical protein
MYSRVCRLPFSQQLCSSSSIYQHSIFHSEFFFFPLIPRYPPYFILHNLSFSLSSGCDQYKTFFCNIFCLIRSV